MMAIGFNFGKEDWLSIKKIVHLKS